MEAHILSKICLAVDAQETGKEGGREELSSQITRGGCRGGAAVNNTAVISSCQEAEALSKLSKKKRKHEKIDENDKNDINNINRHQQKEGSYSSGWNLISHKISNTKRTRYQSSWDIILSKIVSPISAADDKPVSSLINPLDILRKVSIAERLDNIEQSDNDFDSDDEEEEIDDEKLVELERVKQQYSKENAALRADMVSKENRIQELEELVARLVASNGSSSGREPGLRAVKDIAQNFFNEHSLDGYHLSPKHQVDLRNLIQKEHFRLKPEHRFAKRFMTGDQFKTYLYRLTDRHRKSEQEKKKGKLAAKQTITDKILLELEKNAPFIESGSKEAAYIIQCIMNTARLHPDTSEATRKMLTAILVQIQEFGKKGEDFLKTWGVTPLTRKDIETFKADDENWPYLQAGYYVGLTSVVEYMNVQTDGSRSHSYGARETVRGIAVNLGLGKQCSQVVAMGAISDSMFICRCRRSASIVESSLQTFFKGMYILAPRNKPRSREVCVVSLQKIHDSGASSETIGDGDGTQANGVFITCIPSHSATTNVRNTDGTFKVIDSFIPRAPVPTFANVKVPQGFGRGGTKPE